MTTPEAFFEPLDAGRFVSTQLTRGPWDPGFQHAGPPSALLARALERVAPREDAQFVRVSVEILRPVPVSEVKVHAEVLRGGRRVELLAGTLSAGGADILRATAWRIRTEDVAVGVPTPGVTKLAGPETGSDRPFFLGEGEIGYHTGMQWRFLDGGFLEPGPARVWMRMRVPLVAGEEPSPLQRVLTAADSGNGVSAALDIRRYLFINPDLTVALHRLPRSDWVALDARTTVEPHGVGLTDTVLHDLHGPIGRGLQTLYVAQQ